MGPIIPLFEKRQNVYALKKFSDTKIQLLSVKPWDLKFSAPSTQKVFEDSKYGGLNIELTQYNIYINIWDRYQPVLRYYPDPSDESGNFWVDPVNSLLEFDNATLTAVGRVIINIVELDDHDGGGDGGNQNDHDDGDGGDQDDHDDGDGGDQDDHGCDEWAGVGSPLLAAFTFAS